jgi:hypothetical protein
MRNQREEANVSDGPPVEHSIMKRAWPYALALAVVVTGCYLALVPLLRSLNPGPTATASATLVGSSTTTVSQSKVIPFSGTASDHGFTALVKQPASKKKAKKTSVKGKPGHTSTATTTHEFVTPTTPTTSTSTSSSPPSTSTNTVKTTAKTPAKKPAANTQRAPVGGTIDQTDNGGFAGQGNGDSTMAGGKTSTLAGN